VAPPVHQHVRGQFPQLQPLQVQGSAQIGERGVEQVGPVVEAEALVFVGRHPAADAVAGLQDGDVQTGAAQPSGCREPGDPGPDDDDVGGTAVAYGLERVLLRVVERGGCRHGMALPPWP